MGGGLGYSGQNSSGIGLDLFSDASARTGAAGNIGGQNFNLGSLGIGNTTLSVPPWVWYVAAGVAVLYVWKKMR